MATRFQCAEIKSDAYDVYNICDLIPRLHNQAGSTSCYMLARRASSMFA